MGKPTKSSTASKRRSLDSSTNLTRVQLPSSGSMSIISLEKRNDGKKYLESVLPHILQRMNKKANVKTVICAMKMLVSSLTNDYGLEFKNGKSIDNTIENIVLTALAPQVSPYKQS